MVSSFSAAFFALASAMFFAAVACFCLFCRSSSATASLARTFMTLPASLSAAVTAPLVFSSSALALACCSLASATSRAAESSITLFWAACSAVPRLRFCAGCAVAVAPLAMPAIASAAASASAAIATTLRPGDRGATFQNYSKTLTSILSRPHPHAHLP